MSDREHDSVGTGILPVLYGQARRLSHQAMAKLGMSSGDLNETKLLATAIGTPKSGSEERGAGENERILLD
jgi:hypothetical protein